MSNSKYVKVFKGELNGDKDINHFRKPKSQDEIDREAFKVLVAEKLHCIHQDDFTPEEVASVLCDLGFTAPKGG